MAKAPEMGLFGAAIPPDAEVQHADEEAASYRAKVRIDDVINFYEAVYGTTKGLEIAVNRDSEPHSIAITSGSKCPDAEFAMIAAVATPKGDKLVDIVVTKRPAPDGEDYPNSSPWEEPS